MLNEEQTVQSLLKMVKATEEIPMPCWKLTMFHVFTAEQDGKEAVNILLPTLKRN